MFVPLFCSRIHETSHDLLRLTLTCSSKYRSLRNIKGNAAQLQATLHKSSKRSKMAARVRQACTPGTRHYRNPDTVGNRKYSNRKEKKLQEMENHSQPDSKLAGKYSHFDTHPTAAAAAPRHTIKDEFQPKNSSGRKSIWGNGQQQINFHGVFDYTGPRGELKQG